MDRIISDKSNTNPDSLCPLQHHIVLRNIFSCVNLPTLKTARLVCRTWSEAGVARLRTGKLLYLQIDPVGRHQLRLFPCGKTERIQFKAPLTPQDAQEIKYFITHGRIFHKLRLSFQSFPWFHRENDFIYGSDLADINKAGEIYTLERPPNRDTLVLQLLFSTGPWVTVLRLETTLVDAEDAQLLAAVFSYVPNLIKCYLDIVHWKELGWLSLPKENLFPPFLTTLGLQLHRNYVDAIKDQDTEVFSHHAATHFMTAVSHSNIKFLDFEKSNQFCNNMKSCHKKLFVEVIHSMLTKEPGSFPHLTGFKIRLDFGDWWTEDNNLWNTFPKSLSHLNIEIVQWPRKWGIGKLSKVVSILQRHAFTLQTLTLNWVADEDVVSYTKLELPRLPLLTTLDFMSDSNVSISDGWTMEMLDCLKLRELFLGGQQALKARLPCLTTLSYFLLDESGTEIWTHMFPAGHAFPQIETLNISLAIEVKEELDSCISPLLSYFHTIFPNLRILRHIKRLQKRDNTDEPVDWVCKHSFHNGVAAKSLILNPWMTLQDDSRHRKYDEPMHFLLRSHEFDPFLFFDVP